MKRLVKLIKKFNKYEMHQQYQKKLENFLDSDDDLILEDDRYNPIKVICIDGEAPNYYSEKIKIAISSGERSGLLNKHIAHTTTEDQLHLDDMRSQYSTVEFRNRESSLANLQISNRDKINYIP